MLDRFHPGYKKQGNSWTWQGCTLLTVQLVSHGAPAAHAELAQPCRPAAPLPSCIPGARRKSSHQCPAWRTGPGRHRPLCCRHPPRHGAGLHCHRVAGHHAAVDSGFGLGEEKGLDSGVMLSPNASNCSIAFKGSLWIWWALGLLPREATEWNKYPFNHIGDPCEQL